ALNHAWLCACHQPGNASERSMTHFGRLKRGTGAVIRCSIRRRAATIESERGIENVDSTTAGTVTLSSIAVRDESADGGTAFAAAAGAAIAIADHNSTHVTASRVARDGGNAWESNPPRTLNAPNRRI